ncbi:MAG: hypothetical protein JNG83_02880 [Opitutaceae bacterium]|nr:hypothetical protein [Opitutaceae bacterium]
MAISILFGPGGSGKSMYQMHIIVRELLHSRRNIVTNMALNVPEFNAYLERVYPNAQIDLVKRLRILTPTETLEFWKYRGPDVWNGATGDEYHVESDPGIHGVAYVIDEAGASGFSAQGWAAETGRSRRGTECSWYLDQQRKFGDNVYASTNGRFPTGIAKAFRDKAHDFTKLRNGMLTRMGMFRGSANFKRTHYTQEPGPNTEPYDIGTFPMDFKGLGACYRTQDGVGITGHMADKGAKGKGIPIIWVFPMILAVGLLCVIVPMMIGRSAAAYISGPKSEVSKKIDAAAGSLGTPTKSVPPPAKTEQAMQKEEPPAKTPVEDSKAIPAEKPAAKVAAAGVYATGRVMTRGRVLITMSDGTVRTDLDNTPGEPPRLTRATGTFADFDGIRHWYRPRIDTAASK